MIDPYEMGEPVRRRRFYFLLIRVDVAVATGSSLDEHANALMAVGLRPQRAMPPQKLLANSSPEVVGYVKKQVAEKQKRKKTSAIAALQGDQIGKFAIVVVPARS